MSLGGGGQERTRAEDWMAGGGSTDLVTRVLEHLLDRNRLADCRRKRRRDVMTR